MSEQTVDTSERPIRSTSGLGVMLRNAREKSGLSIADVSQAIRIQGVYLAAIEDERFGDLPAPTYAFGFVRAYANYLNLDADEAVRRMKLDNADAEASQMLNFPLPSDIERGPSRRMKLGAIAVALMVYGIWYLSVQTDVPSGQISDASQPAIEAPAPAIVESTEVPAEVPAQVPESPVPVSPAPVIPDIAALTPEAVPAATLAPSPAINPGTAPVATPPVDTPDAPEVAAESETAPDEPTPIAPELPDIAALTPQASPVTAPSPVAEPAPLPQTANTEAPAASGAPAIRLKAISDAWIEVKRADGEVIATRVLPAGQEYVPPSEPGLRLTTGDAGALEIYVNGAIIPPLGRRGDIKRAVLLDPASLTAGPGAN